MTGLDEDLLRRAALGQINKNEKCLIREVLSSEARDNDPRTKIWACPWHCTKDATHSPSRYISNGNCVECIKNYEKSASVKSKKKTYRDTHSDQTKAYYIQWKAQNPDYAKEYYENNAEVWRERARRWYRDNTLAANARSKLWGKENPEARATLSRNRRARKRKAYGTHDVDDKITLLEQQSNCCANPLCLTDVTTRSHVDHIHPLSRGGRNDIVNLQILCPFCNGSKKDKTMDEWLDPDSYATWRAAREVYYPTDVASLITPAGYTGPMTEVEADNSRGEGCAPWDTVPGYTEPQAQRRGPQASPV